MSIHKEIRLAALFQAHKTEKTETGFEARASRTRVRRAALPALQEGSESPLTFPLWEGLECFSAVKTAGKGSSMNIGQASRSSGVTAKMIRYYESIGLLPEAARKESGYRDYNTMDVHRLAFVRRARDLGFSIERIRELLLLWSDRDRGNADVRAVANAHIAELQDQAAKLEEMIGTLRHLVRSCRGENRADCPIMADLSRGAAARPRKYKRKGTSCHAAADA